MRTVKIAILCLIVGALMLCPAVVTAQAMWATGTVTKAPWQDTYIHVGVNDVAYTFLNKSIRIAQHYQVKPGMYNERRLTLSDLTVGTAVKIRAQGHRIYEIRVAEGR